MLHRSFKPAKCKTVLQMAVSRLKVLKNKKEIQIKQLKKELSLLLEAGDDQTARIRVEHVVREEKTLAAFALVGIYCELVVSRLQIIDSQKTCPIDLKEAVTSIAFAAQRLSDVPELMDALKHLKAKYGKEFISAAVELRPGSGVSRLLIEKLSTKAPDGPTKLKILSTIAEQYNVSWEPKSFGETDVETREDLLNGPKTFEKASSMHKESPKIQRQDPPTVQTEAKVDSPPKSYQNYDTPINPNAYDGRSSSHFQNVDASNTEPRSPARHHGTGTERMESRDSYYRDDKSSSQGTPNWNMEFKDATAAAQAAAESAERANMAARAAAELASQERMNEIPRQHGSSTFRSEHPERDTVTNTPRRRDSKKQYEDTGSSERVSDSFRRRDPKKQYEDTGSSETVSNSSRRRDSKKQYEDIGSSETVSNYSRRRDSKKQYEDISSSETVSNSPRRRDSKKQYQDIGSSDPVTNSPRRRDSKKQYEDIGSSDIATNSPRRRDSKKQYEDIGISDYSNVSRQSENYTRESSTSRSEQLGRDTYNNAPRRVNSKPRHEDVDRNNENFHKASSTTRNEQHGRERVDSYSKKRYEADDFENNNEGNNDETLLNNHRIKAEHSRNSSFDLRRSGETLVNKQDGKFDMELQSHDIDYLEELRGKKHSSQSPSGSFSSRGSLHSHSGNVSYDQNVLSDFNPQQEDTNSVENVFATDEKENIQKTSGDVGYYEEAVFFDDYGSDSKFKFDSDGDHIEPGYGLHSPGRASPENARSWSFERKLDSKKYSSKSDIFTEQHSTSELYDTSTSGIPSRVDDLAPASYDSGPESEMEEERSMSKSHSRGSINEGSSKVSVSYDSDPDPENEEDQTHMDRNPDSFNKSVIEKQRQESHKSSRWSDDEEIEEKDVDISKLDEPIEDSGSGLDLGALIGGFRHRAHRLPPFMFNPTETTSSAKLEPENTKFEQSASSVLKSAKTHNRQPYIEKAKAEVTKKSSYVAHEPFSSSDDESEEETIVRSRDKTTSIEERHRQSRVSVSYQYSSSSDLEEEVPKKPLPVQSRPNTVFSRRTKVSPLKSETTSNSKSPVSLNDGEEDPTPRSSYPIGNRPRSQFHNPDSDYFRSPQDRKAASKLVSDPKRFSDEGNLNSSVKEQAFTSSPNSSYTARTRPRSPFETPASYRSENLQTNKVTADQVGSKLGSDPKNLSYEGNSKSPVKEQPSIAAPLKFKTSSLKSPVSLKDGEEESTRRRSTYSTGNRSRSQVQNPNKSPQHPKGTDPVAVKLVSDEIKEPVFPSSPYAAKTRPRSQFDNPNLYRAENLQNSKSTDEVFSKLESEAAKTSSAKEQPSTSSANAVAASGGGSNKPSLSRETSREKASHVHPKLPDIDDLMAQLNSIRTNRK